MLELLTDIVLIITAAAFLLGLVLTAVTGSARSVKLLLLWASVALVVALLIGLVLSRGLLIFLTFQLVSLVLLWYLVLIVGAACGGGIYWLRHRKPRGRVLRAEELVHHLSLQEFSKQEGIDASRVLSRLQSGYYQGGRYQGQWHVHQSEQQLPAATLTNSMTKLSDAAVSNSNPSATVKGKLAQGALSNSG